MALPSYGTLNFDMISEEIGITGSKSLNDLIQESNLTDKTAPHQISQFYGYRHDQPDNPNWNLLSADVEQTILYTSIVDTNPIATPVQCICLAISQDGTKMLIGTTSSATTYDIKFESFTMSTAFDLSTRTSIGTYEYTPSGSSVSQPGSSNQIPVNIEGTSLYIPWQNTSGNDIRMKRFTMSTAFNCTTLAFADETVHTRTSGTDSANWGFDVCLFEISKFFDSTNVKLITTQHESTNDIKYYFTKNLIDITNLHSNWTELNFTNISSFYPYRYITLLGKDKVLLCFRNLTEIEIFEFNRNTGSVTLQSGISYQLSLAGRVSKITNINDDKLVCCHVEESPTNTFKLHISLINTNYSAFQNDTTAPSNPSSLSVTNVTVNSFCVNWVSATDNVKVISYKIFVDNVLFVTVPFTSNFYDFTNRTTNQTYSIKIVAVDGNLNESSGATISATAEDNISPSNPTNLSVSAVGSVITLTWTASTDNVAVDYYTPEVQFDGGNWGIMPSVNHPTVTTTYPVLSSGTYNFRVRAIDTSGNLSGYSNQDDIVI